MKTTLIAIALACSVIAVAAFTLPSADGVECILASTSDGHDGPRQTVRYTFLSGGSFAQDGSIARMTTNATTITLGEDVDGLNGTRFSAITIDKATGAYRWEAHGPGWSSATTGKCRRVGP